MPADIIVTLLSQGPTQDLPHHAASLTSLPTPILSSQVSTEHHTSLLVDL